MKKDFYTRKAEEEDTRARSYYKLQEIDKKNRVIKKGDSVLDLGCYPGGWTKYCLEKVGNEGFVLGVDVDEIEPFDNKNYCFIKGDIFSEEVLEEISKCKFDVVLSDMAPKTTGVRNLDQVRSYELSKKAFDIASKVLKNNGNFLCKIFQGPDFDKFRKKLEKEFIKVKLVKPQASKSKSKEIYILGLGFKG